MSPAGRVTLGKYVVGWFLLALLAIGNGLVRETTYGKLMPELAAHQVSTLTAMLLVAVVLMAMHRAWPLASAAHALAVGSMWLVLTVSFEFLFGHYVAGHSWARLLQDYNLLQGRVWSLFLVWLVSAPWLVHRLAGTRPGRGL